MGESPFNFPAWLRRLRQFALQHSMTPPDASCARCNYSIFIASMFSPYLRTWWTSYEFHAKVLHSEYVGIRPATPFQGFGILWGFASCFLDRSKFWLSILHCELKYKATVAARIIFIIFTTFILYSSSSSINQISLFGLFQAHQSAINYIASRPYLLSIRKLFYTQVGTSYINMQFSQLLSSSLPFSASLPPLLFPHQTPIPRVLKQELEPLSLGWYTQRTLHPHKQRPI